MSYICYMSESGMTCDVTGTKWWRWTADITAVLGSC